MPGFFGLADSLRRCIVNEAGWSDAASPAPPSSTLLFVQVFGCTSVYWPCRKPAPPYRERDILERCRVAADAASRAGAPGGCERGPDRYRYVVAPRHLDRESGAWDVVIMVDEKPLK